LQIFNGTVRQLTLIVTVTSLLLNALLLHCIGNKLPLFVVKRVEDLDGSGPEVFLSFSCQNIAVAARAVCWQPVSLGFHHNIFLKHK
jgi:hypothetical protein